MTAPSMNPTSSSFSHRHVVRAFAVTGRAREGQFATNADDDRHQSMQADPDPCRQQRDHALKHGAGEQTVGAARERPENYRNSVEKHDGAETGIRIGDTGRVPHAVDTERHCRGNDRGQNIVLDPVRRDGGHRARVGSCGHCQPPEPLCPSERRLRQTTYCPPLAVSVEPVMKPASSAARKTTQRAISSGSPSRPTGICGRMFFSSTSFGTALTISVAI